MARNAVDVHYVSIDFVLFHDLQSFPGCNRQPQNVGVKHFLPRFSVAVRNRVVRHHSSVVDEYVDCPQVLFDPLEALHDFLLDSQIHFH